MTHREFTYRGDHSSTISRTARAALGLAVTGFALAAGGGGCDRNDGAKPLVATTGPAGGATGAAAHGGTGVIDYDRVFKDLGWLEEISAAMQKSNAELQAAVEAFGRDLNAAVEEARTRLADAAKLTAAQRDDFRNGRNLDTLPFTPQQKDEWGRTVANAGQFFQRANAQAQQVSQQRENQMVAAYKDAAQPALRRVAESAGLTVVSTPAQVVYFHSSVDVTAQVVEELRAAPPPRNVPEALKFELPKIQLSAPPPATAPTTGPSLRATPRTR